MKLYIHGLLGTGEGYKAMLVRQQAPDVIAPDFTGTLDERMAQLDQLLQGEQDVILVGSSLGGLMATLWTCAHPDRACGDWCCWRPP